MSSQKVYHITSVRKNLYVTEIGRKKNQETDSVKPYMRNVYIFHFVLEGTLRFCNTEVHAGQGFLASKQNVHSMYMPGAHEVFWIAFDGEQADAFLKLIGFMPDRHAVFDITDLPMVKKILSDAFETYPQKEKEEIVMSALFASIPFLSVKAQEAPKELGYFEMAVSLMKRNHYRSISVTEIAKQIHISEKHLCKLFKQKCGKAPKQYLTEIRMEASKKMLLESELTVKQIAEIEGFHNQGAFSQAFLKFYGFPPTELRKKERL